MISVDRGTAGTVDDISRQRNQQEQWMISVDRSTEEPTGTVDDISRQRYSRNSG